MLFLFFENILCLSSVFNFSMLDEVTGKTKLIMMGYTRLREDLELKARGVLAFVITKDFLVGN